MENTENRIKELVKESLHSIQYNLTEIVQRDNTYYVMVEVASKINENIASEIEQKIFNELQLKAKICFIQTTQQVKKMQKIPKTKKSIDGVKKVIMVCSGEGGVGKSTVSAAIAYFLQTQGFKVGLFDAEIYGLSIPKIFNLKEEVKIKDSGIKLMSMGFVVNSNDALVWRGPMVSKTLHNILVHAAWHSKNLRGMKSNLDYLIIDTPPGTGDVHLSLAENYSIDGAIIVSTP